MRVPVSEAQRYVTPGVDMKQTWMTLGISPTLKAQAKEVAKDQKISLSELVRKAIAQYIGVE